MAVHDVPSEAAMPVGAGGAPVHPPLPRLGDAQIENGCGPCGTLKPKTSTVHVPAAGLFTTTCSVLSREFRVVWTAGELGLLGLSVQGNACVLDGLNTRRSRSLMSDGMTLGVPAGSSHASVTLSCGVPAGTVTL